MDGSTIAPCGGVYDRMLHAAMTGLVPEEEGAESSGLYASLLDLAGRMLAELAAGHSEADAAWCYQVLQVQVPAMRTAAGYTLAPPLASELEPLAELELTLRERYGIPEPSA